MLSRLAQMRRSMCSAAVAFHRDERGAEGLEKLLILAAVALPLLGLLIYFRDDITGWLRDVWSTENARGRQKPYDDSSYGGN